MRFSYILKIICIQILFITCSDNSSNENNVKDSLQSDEWTSSYHENNTFYFVSNFGVEDTLKITSSTIKDFKSPFSKSYLINRKHGKYSFIIKREYQTFKGAVKIDYKNDSIYIQTTLNDVERLYIISHNDNYNFGTDFKIFGKVIKRCIIVTNFNLKGDSSKKNSNHIVKYVISYKSGLIYYLFDDGEEFYRKDIF